MGTLYDRIKEVADYYNLSINRLEEDLGVSQGVFTKLKNPEKDTNVSNIRKLILKFRSINAHWLITGDGEMMAQHEVKGDLEKENQRLEEELGALKIKYNRNNEKLIIAQDNVIGMQEEINRLKSKKGQ